MSNVKHTEERTETHACVCERTETHDLISRKAAINAINSWFEIAKHPMNRGAYNNGELAAYSTAISEIENLPSAEPERNGRWIADGKHTDHNGIEWKMMHCSVCGNKDIDSEVTRTPFCPWCGARMDGEQE